MMIESLLKLVLDYKMICEAVPLIYVHKNNYRPNSSITSLGLVVSKLYIIISPQAKHFLNLVNEVLLSYFQYIKKDQSR